GVQRGGRHAVYAGRMGSPCQPRRSPSPRGPLLHPGGGEPRTIAGRADTAVCQTPGMSGVDRHPVLSAVGDGVTQIDTLMVGEPEFNAVYLVAAAEPALIETGPGADVPLVLEALRGLGIDAHDLAHILVT